MHNAHISKMSVKVKGVSPRLILFAIVAMHCRFTSHMIIIFSSIIIILIGHHILIHHNGCDYDYLHKPECDIRMDFDTNEYPNIFVSRK